MFKRLGSLLSTMKGADLNISDRVIRVHVVQISEIQGKSSASEDFTRGTSSVKSSQKPVAERGRVCLHSVLEEEEKMHEPLIDLEMQAVQDGDIGVLDDFGGWSYVQDIVVNTSVLAASSVYFRRMLASGLQESLSNDRLIELMLFSHEATFFEALVEFMHSQEIRPTICSDKESLCWLLILADRFETPACIRKCVEHLMATPVSLADVVMCVNLPETVKRHPSVRVLMDAVCEYACWSFEGLAAAESIHTMDERCIKKLIASPSYGRRWSKDDVERLFAVCVEWFRYGGEERWEAFSAFVLYFESWRLQRSFIENLCSKLRTRKGQELLEKVEAGCPWRLKEAKDAGIQPVDLDQLGILGITHQGTLGGHPWLSMNREFWAILPGENVLDGLTVADSILLVIAVVNFLAGLVIPLVFGILSILHGKAYRGVVLLALTFTGVLPLGSFYVTGWVGFRGLSLYRRLIEDEIVHLRQYDYL